MSIKWIDDWNDSVKKIKRNKLVWLDHKVSNAIPLVHFGGQGRADRYLYVQEELDDLDVKDQPSSKIH